jgi:4-amino-4-deoxy-L-arabinose transferase-like glycosyltransferase
MTKYKIIILSIIFLAFFLRIFQVQYSPPSLNWDEAALGYNSYSLLKTGKDEYGNRFPLLIRSFDDYKPPIYSYFSIPFIYVFGLNELSVRILSVLSGTLSVFLIYLIGKEVFNKKVGILAAFLFAIQPWSIHFSRMAFEATVALPITLSSIYFFLQAKSKKQVKYVYLTLITIIISSFAYYSNRALFLPIVIFTLIYHRNLLKDNRAKITSGLIILLLSSPTILMMIKGEGLARFHNTSIFSLVKNFSGSYFSLTDNTFLFLAKNVFARYLSFFSPANLFVRGTPEPIQRIFGYSVFYPIEFIFYLSGLYFLMKRYKKYWIFLAFLLFLPTPAAITWNWFSPVRVLPFFSLLSIVFGYGAIKLWQSASKLSAKVAVVSAIGVAIIYLNSFAGLLTTQYLYIPYAEKGDWQFGFREIMNEIKPYYQKYDQVILETGHAQPHIFTLFYLKYDPAQYHQDIGCPTCVDIPRTNWDLGNFKFRKIFWPKDRDLTNTLFIGSEYNLPTDDIKSTKNANKIKDLYDHHGQFVARIVETFD